jgi:proteasome assembly chaperone 3
LLGTAPTQHLQSLHALYTAQIASLIWATKSEKLFGNTRPSVIVGLALKKPAKPSDEGSELKETEIFLAVMNMVMELLQGDNS